MINPMFIHGETSPCPLVSTSFERAEARCYIRRTAMCNEHLAREETTTCTGADHLVPWEFPGTQVASGRQPRGRLQNLRSGWKLEEKNCGFEGCCWKSTNFKSFSRCSPQFGMDPMDLGRDLWLWSASCMGRNWWNWARQLAVDRGILPGRSLCKCQIQRYGIQWIKGCSQTTAEHHAATNSWCSRSLCHHRCWLHGCHAPAIRRAPDGSRAIATEQAEWNEGQRGSAATAASSAGDLRDFGRTGGPAFGMGRWGCEVRCAMESTSERWRLELDGIAKLQLFS